MKQWYVQLERGTVTGPFQLEELRAELEKPDVPADTLVNEAGAKDWVLWSTVPELSAVVKAKPAAAPEPALRRSKRDLGAIAPLAASGLLALALLAIAVLQTRRAGALDGELRAARTELEAVSDRVDAVETESRATGETAASAVTRIEAVSSSVAKQQEMLVFIGERTEGIGFRSIGWSYRGLAGATSLEVKVRAVPNKTACRVSGNFQFSNRDLLPKDATARLSDDGGAQLYETTIDLSEGAFAFEAPVACERVEKLFLSRS